LNTLVKILWQECKIKTIYSITNSLHKYR